MLKVPKDERGLPMANPRNRQNEIVCFNLGTPGAEEEEEERKNPPPVSIRRTQRIGEEKGTKEKEGGIGKKEEIEKRKRRRDGAM